MAATFADWLRWPDREEFLLCELTPAQDVTGWTATGGLYANTWQATLTAFVQASVVTGGLYAPVVGVQQDASTLTERASVALVDANAGSWYWDAAAGLLYVRPTAAADPDTFTMQALRRLYFANAPIVLDGIYYHPWLTGEAPRVRRAVEDLLSGATYAPSGSVALINPEGVWFTLVAPDGGWNWRNRAAAFSIGGRYNGLSLARADYAPVATLLIDDVAPDERVCKFALKSKSRLTEIEVPVTPYFEADYANLGDGVRGTRKWIGYGRATIKPDLTNTSSHGVYTVADADYQTLFAVHDAWAINKQTGVWTLLTLTTHYTVDLTACTLTVVSGTYAWQNYEIAVDVTGKPDGAGSYLATYGEITRDLLETFLGAPAAEIDTAAFAQADIDAESDLALWIKQPRSLASVLSTGESGFPSLARSAMAALYETTAGQWTCSVWSPSVDGVTTTLRKEDFAQFTPRPKLKTTYSTVRVHYDFDHARQSWAVAEATDLPTQYRTGSRDRLDLFTYLTDAGVAANLATRYLLLAGAVTVEAEFEERGALLAQHAQGEKVYVTFSPAPNAAGAYGDKPFEALSLEIEYAPKLRVRGVLGDLRGLGGKVGRWMDSTDPDWSAATTNERINSGFWTDSDGRADSGDAASAGQSIWW